MLLGEPPRTQYDLNFALFGIPVRVHPFFWLIALFLGMHLPGAVYVIMWIGAVFIGVLVHEMGHALVMRAYGFYPWITLYSFGGLASYDQRNNFRSASSGGLGQILISLAGPGAGFLLAGLLLLGVYAAGYGNGITLPDSGLPIPGIALPSHKLGVMIEMLLFVCIAWGVLNLLPIYPLDGGQVAREIMVHVNSRDGIRMSLQLSVVVAICAAAYGVVQWKSFLMAFFFGYFAFTNFVALKAYNWRGPW